MQIEHQTRASGHATHNAALNSPSG